MIVKNDVGNVIGLIGAGTKISAKVLFAWMMAENNDIQGGLPSNNNPLNIRYTGSKTPWDSGYPWFTNTNGIQTNKVVVYNSPEDFAHGVVTLLTECPEYYGAILEAAASGDDLATAAAIEESPWDAGHYQRSGDQPGNIVQLVSHLVLEEPAEEAPAPTPDPKADVNPAPQPYVMTDEESEALAWAKSVGLIQGDGTDDFGAGEPLKRGHFVIVLKRLHDLGFLAK